MQSVTLLDEGSWNVSKETSCPIKRQVRASTVPEAADARFQRLPSTRLELSDSYTPSAGLLDSECRIFYTVEITVRNSCSQAGLSPP